MLWVLIAAVTLAAMAAVVVPLFRAREAGPDRSAFDRAVYRDQLAEIARDLERGVLTESEAAAARLEVERRLLAAAEPAAAAPGGARVDPITTVFLAASVSAGAVALYLVLGSPAVKDQPLAARGGAAQVADAGKAAPGGLEDSADRLVKKLAANPDDADGWQLLARTQAVLERWPDAAQSYKRALALTGPRPDLLAGYGEMLVLGADGIVSPEAKDSFAKAVAADPANLPGRFYLALADAQAGKPREAIDAWQRVAADSPDDAPWMGALHARIAEAAKAAGIDPPAPLPKTALAAEMAKPPAETAPPAAAGSAPGPTASDMAAAANMSPEDRQAMIRGMVEKLAARMEQNPGDAAGWDRLANAYRVLGETAKANDAAKRAAAARAGQPAVASAEPPRGPTASDMAAAATMSPDDRQAMIRGMVEKLAARMEQNPGDAAGWDRLANAYRVLGETAKADDAAKRAAAARAGQPAGAAASSPAPSSATPQPGPTGAEIDAAKSLSPDQRKQMVEGMVANLAQRLEKEPNDAAGWARLGRSYRVLGQPQKAEEALARAVALKPNDPEILLEQGHAVLDAAGGGRDPSKKLPPRFVEIMKKIEGIAPQQPEALWYLGLAEVQQQRPEGAVGYWRRLLAMLPPGTDDYKSVQQAVDALQPAKK
jgi:cytochrome c-type biogenesis protein CcmH